MVEQEGSEGTGQTVGSTGLILVRSLSCPIRWIRTLIG